MGNVIGDIGKIFQTVLPLVADAVSGNWVGLAEDLFKDIANATGDKSLQQIAQGLQGGFGSILNGPPSSIAGNRSPNGGDDSSASNSASGVNSPSSSQGWQNQLAGVVGTLANAGATLPSLQNRIGGMVNGASSISQGIGGGSYNGTYNTPGVSYASPNVTAQYGGSNSVINQGVANGAFSTALTSDQQNMLNEAQQAGASGPQLAMMQLQMQMENQQEVLQAISKIFNMLDQTAKATIQNF